MVNLKMYLELFSYNVGKLKGYSISNNLNYYLKKIALLI